MALAYNKWQQCQMASFLNGVTELALLFITQTSLSSALYLTKLIDVPL
jgi:hypothetical protein